MKKRVIGAAAAVWLTGYAVAMTTCGTSGFKGAFLTPVLVEADEIGSPLKEFDQPEYVAHKHHEHRGALVGTLEESGTEYYRYHFKNILPGDGRILEILAPRDGHGAIVVREAKEAKPEVEGALLINQCFCGYCCPSGNGGEHVLHTNALGSDDFFYTFYDKDSGELVGEYSTGRIELPWKRRSRARYALQMAQTVYAVPLDILLFPYQFISCALYGV